MLLSLVVAQAMSPMTAPHGMVVSDSRIASAVGRDIMKKGGNAVDAAVATALALAVTLPAAGNLGGGGFMMIRLGDGRASSVDFRETAPAAATRNMYVAHPQNSTLGYRAVGIPGTPAGLWLAHRSYGKLPWGTLLAPAIRLAHDGFAVSRELAASLQGHAKIFREFPESYHQFNLDGAFLKGGDTFRQPVLEATLRRLLEGPNGFYRGETARLITSAMRKNGGLITERDLAGFAAQLREPLRSSYHGVEILTMPPPSSGGIALLQMLATVDGKLSSFGSVDTVHTTVEAMKRAFADRSEYLGDPAFVKVPTAMLLSKKRIDRFRSEIGLRATPSDAINRHNPPHEGNHTTHFTVVDAQGAAVSCTFTLNLGYGSGVTVAGFLLNNEMDDFASAPGRPNAFGLIQGEANAIAPGKRPLSLMTPTILVKNGKLFMALGSPGGPTIINTVFETILNVLDFGMDIEHAVTAPRYHHQWKPDTISFEPFALSPEVISGLRAKGHVFAERSGTQGSCHAVMILPDGWRAAGVDPRLPDAGAAGY